MWWKSHRSKVREVRNVQSLIDRIDVEYIPASFTRGSESYRWGSSPELRDRDHQRRFDRLLAMKKELVEEYSERSFLLRDYLPRAQGPVLDVGVNSPNAHDSLALPDPESHWTIDINPSVAVYGSARHQTIDFFDFESDTRFRHIIMFGLIGTPNNRTESDAHISFDLNERLIAHATELLATGGELVLGPELSGESREAADEDVAQWLSWCDQNPVLVEGFRLVYALRGRCNLLAVFRKESE